MSLFQASEHMLTISSSDLKMRLLSQLSRMNCHMFSTGLSSGDLGGKDKSVMLDGILSLPVVPASLIENQDSMCLRRHLG